MQPSHQDSRINLVQLKADIVKRLGPERSKQYFSYLNRLLALKLTKAEFNKLCFRILGKENVALHNKLICSILRNACHAKLPPARNEELPKPTLTKAPNQPVFLNANILPLSPKKARSSIRDRKAGDCPVVVLNGKADFGSHQLAGTGDADFPAISENGHFTPVDTQKLLQQHHQEPIEKSKNEREVSFHHPAKLSLINTPPDGLVSVNNKDQNDLVAEGGKALPSRSLLQAPLGIPFFSVSVGAARKSLPLVSSVRSTTSLDSGRLYDIETLRERMQQIATTHGLEGVSVDSANLLNNGLDIYLKGIIRSCMEMVGARCGHDITNNSSNKQQSGGKLVNGVWRGHHYQFQSSCRPWGGVQEGRSCRPVSLLDFKVAMELNPQQLGEDWPLLLEKMSMDLFEEQDFH